MATVIVTVVQGSTSGQDGSQPMKSVATALVLLGSLHPFVASADVGGIEVRWDRRSRMQTVVPRQRTDVRMVAEDVRLVPYYDPRFSREPTVLVDARFEFLNPGKARDVMAGFPEMLTQVHECHTDSETGAGPDCYLPFEEWRKRRERGGTIEQLSVEVDGKAIPSKPIPGKAPYRRWFTFTIPMADGARTHVRTVFLVHPTHSSGASQETLNEGPGYDGWAIEYVLHTGSTWQGPIGEGVVRLFQPGHGKLERRFRNLRPTRSDDLEARHLADGNRQARKILAALGRRPDPVPETPGVHRREARTGRRPSRDGRGVADRGLARRASR